ncbi:MAG: family 1 glycosylhydrolase [Actinobacteria bacterium]|nr:family 1 glycosylhydrolase [Actinomycetota bacterium]
MTEPVTTRASFPDGFSWGTATAAHQIEGGNWNNDWWRHEHQPGTLCAEPSGDACDSYHRWAEDADLVASLGFTDYRFSVEWSRVEPAPGEWSVAALDHYRRICDGLTARGVNPVVTLHHFTTPRWLADLGGWESADTVERFATFCEKVAVALGDVMTRACTINEPNVVAFYGWSFGVFPPGKRDPDLADRVTRTFIDAHRAAVEAIRTAAPGVPVGLTLSMSDWAAVGDGDDRTRAEAKLARYREFMEDRFLAATEGDDFIGVQAYSRARVGPDGVLRTGEEGVPMLPMGYELWPQALEATLRRAWEVTGGRVPLLVTENGIGTDDDDQRISYVERALEGVLRAIADGVDVRGYTYWSLLDNFEWVFGYRPKFGLVSVDRTTFERTPKPSAAWLGEIARAGTLPGDA